MTQVDVAVGAGVGETEAREGTVTGDFVAGGFADAWLSATWATESTAHSLPFESECHVVRPCVTQSPSLVLSWLGKIVDNIELEIVCFIEWSTRSKVTGSSQ